MPTPLPAGHPVSVSEAVVPGPQVARGCGCDPQFGPINHKCFIHGSETPQEHVRNALALIEITQRVPTVLTAEDHGPMLRAACLRLRRAIEQLEGRVT